MATHEQHIHQFQENKLQEKSIAISKKCRIQIDVLKVADIDVHGQWEERLRQAKDINTGKRIILIPCLVERSHWTGVIIQFQSSSQIGFAEFLDPVIESDFNPTNLQKTFTKVYPSSILNIGKCEKHLDRSQSMELTMKNLLSAAERAGIIFICAISI